jgi:hypothetical protein
MDIELKRVLIYRRDLMKIVNDSTIKPVQIGTLWVECLIPLDEIVKLQWNKIWFEELV